MVFSLKRKQNGIQTILMQPKSKFRIWLLITKARNVVDWANLSCANNTIFRFKGVGSKPVIITSNLRVLPIIWLNSDPHCGHNPFTSSINQPSFASKVVKRYGDVSFARQEDPTFGTMYHIEYIKMYEIQPWLCSMVAFPWFENDNFSWISWTNVINLSKRN